MTEIRLNNVALKEAGTAARTNDRIVLREKVRPQSCTYHRQKKMCSSLVKM